MEERLSDYRPISFSPCSVQQRLLLMIALKNFSSYIQVIYDELFFRCWVLDKSFADKLWSIYEFQKMLVAQNTFYIIRCSINAS